jgi:hypothetical protein
MRTPWASLDENDRALLRTTMAFLSTRLGDSGAIDWALQLKSSQRIERIAIRDLLSSPAGLVLKEPWVTAWRLIEESWSASAIEDNPSMVIHGLQKRLRAGDRSGAMVSAIVDLVAPRLNVKPLDSWRWQVVQKPRRPETFHHLLSAGLTSGALVNLNALDLDKISETSFIKALANALEAEMNRGLDIARRLGWEGEYGLWQLGDLSRAFYVSNNQQTQSGEDPDAYHRGIAPSVKLLQAVVSRIAALDVAAALPFVHRWRLAASPIHLRLWAASAQNVALVSAKEVGAFLLACDDQQFWNLHLFPEVAELRALRFGELDPGVQELIVARLRKGPPRRHWPRKADAEKVRTARLYSAVREFKRIEAAGGRFSHDARLWLEPMMMRFPDLAEMAVDDAFPEGPKVSSIQSNPDPRYDTLLGAPRLRALESALSIGQGGWDDIPAVRANDWLQQPDKLALILNDLESIGNGGDEFPRVWGRFGWAHSPRNTEPEREAGRNLQSEADRVLRLVGELSVATLSTAIEGISQWLDTWSKQVVASPVGFHVWQRVWPIAVEATNPMQDKSHEADLSVLPQTAENAQESMDLDTLNTPAGKLIGVFLAACPPLDREPSAGAGSPVRQMRDIIIDASGRSGLIARHRLIEFLPYFLRADEGWARQHLIAPLLSGNTEALALWRAIARRTQFTDVLKIIGGAMAERAIDRRLGRQTRRSLVFSLVVEALYAFRESRDPAVPNLRIQQMLRYLDDEVRGDAANAIQQFVDELSNKQASDGTQPSAADLFRTAAAPFLRDVWPQERSLSTPGVSGALSDLPATSREAFAEAVAAIERFLVPFECWSIIAYGLYGTDNGDSKLSIINDEPKAIAFLRLLDLTIDRADGAVIPNDLAGALDQIRNVAPALVDSPVFRRLATAARR